MTRDSAEVVLSSISKSYAGKKVLDNLDLSMKPGELLALLGPSGCGKTTTLRVLAGMETPDAGSVHIGGVDMTHAPVRGRGIGIVFQSYSLFPHMTAVQNVAYGLRLAGASKSRRSARAAELLEMVESATDRLDGLIGNLLDMSRIQSRSITARTDDVLVADVVNAALATVSDPGRVRVEAERRDLVCRADPGLAERVLANVVENALRYSPAGQDVVVTYAPHRDLVHLRVVDRGPGVPEPARSGMFAPFQRYGDAPRGDGVGLGLAVAKGLTEAMHGTIEADDTPGGGLTMTITLPRAQEER